MNTSFLVKCFVKVAFTQNQNKFDFSLIFPYTFLLNRMGIRHSKILYESRKLVPPAKTILNWSFLCIDSFATFIISAATHSDRILLSLNIFQLSLKIDPFL